MPLNRTLVSTASSFFAEFILTQSCRADSIGVNIDSFAPVIWGRAIERIVIVLVCATSIAFGFFLFRASARETGEMLARGHGFELKLTRIGPGVLFCLFGMAGLTYTVHTQPTLSFGNNKDGNQIVGYLGGVGSSPANDKIFLTTRLEALNFFIEKEIHSQTGESANKSASHALAILRAWREDLIMQIIGQEKYSKYLLAEQTRPTVKLESDPGLRAIYDEIESLRTSITSEE